MESELKLFVMHEQSSSSTSTSTASYTNFDNLVITESVHQLTAKLDIKATNNTNNINDNHHHHHHKVIVTEHNQTSPSCSNSAYAVHSPNNNISISSNNNKTKKLSEFFASFKQHESHKDASTVAAASAVILNYSEDRINNNNNNSNSDIVCTNISNSKQTRTTAGVGIMSHHKNFVLNFDHSPTSSSATNTSPMALPAADETLMSPAEAPFGRRYAEISQFKNHPNVEW